LNLASWVVNMESILHSYCNKIAITSQKFPFIPYWNTLFTSLFNYLWSNYSFLETTLDTKHTINDNCSSVFQINTLLHIMLSQTRVLHLCTENLVWHSIRTWKFHSHDRHNSSCTLNPKTPPIQGACHKGRRKGRQEKDNRTRQSTFTYPPIRKIDRQCPSKYHKLIKALHGYEAS
jgi:hypothetical protein